MSPQFPWLTPNDATSAAVIARRQRMPSLPWLEILPFISVFLFAFVG